MELPHIVNAEIMKRFLIAALVQLALPKGCAADLAAPA
jgi:hypothetical protein